MKLLLALSERPRLALGCAVALMLWGVAVAASIPRQEDPRLPPRWGFLAIPHPGASVDRVERELVHPLELELWRVSEIVRVETTARSGVAVAELELDHRADPDLAWDEVRRALARAAERFPAGAGPISLDDDVVTPDAIVLAVGGADPARILSAARDLERELSRLPRVARVRLLGAAAEQISIDVDDGAALGLGLAPADVAEQLARRGETRGAGELRVADRRMAVQVDSAFASLDDLRAAPLRNGAGAIVPLSALARVRRQPVEPATERFRHDARAGIAVAVGVERGADVIAFGERVRAAVADFRGRHTDVSVEEALFQPAHVAERIDSLQRSLWLASLLVGGLLVALLGLRTGLVVAVTIPGVGFATLALYGAGGGVLHQLSIAALVIASGLIVDNAIVVAEAVLRRLEGGESAADARRGAVRELAGPLAAAAGTTLAAFVPMLLAGGTAADFVRAIPVVVSIAIALSYAFAIAVTPVLAAHAGSGARAGAAGAAVFGAWHRLRRHLPSPARHPRLVLGATGAAIVGVALLAPLVEQRFFPLADRAQLVASLDFGEGTHFEVTDAGALRLERALLQRPEVFSAASFVGRAAPLFYYNLNRRPRTPHLAQIAVTAHDRVALDALAEQLPALARVQVPEASVVVQRLRQGTPVDAPVELRLLGRDLEALAGAADALLARLRRVEGVRDARHDLGLGAPVLAVAVDDVAAGRRGLTRTDVASAVRSRAQGQRVAWFRAERDPIPIVVRAPEPAGLGIERLASLEVSGAGARAPIAQVADVLLDWQPAMLRRHDGRRVVTVLADLAPDAGARQVVAEILAGGLHDALPEGVTLEVGGEVEGADVAHGALLRPLPIAVLLLLVCLLTLFDSYRSVAIILVTVPLAALGIVPGLLLGGQAFGFMSVLGVLALSGIVVNNGIVLVAAIERLRAQGLALDDAVDAAVALRTRPILVTTATTLAGLLPLALSDAALWPPMAWPMISGLLASTALGLAVVPALYRLAFAAEARAGVAATVAG